MLPYAFGSLYCIFCHIVCNYLNSHLQTKVFNFKYIEVTCKSCYLGWLARKAIKMKLHVSIQNG